MKDILWKYKLSWVQHSFDDANNIIVFWVWLDVSHIVANTDTILSDELLSKGLLINRMCKL